MQDRQKRCLEGGCYLATWRSSSLSCASSFYLSFLCSFLPRWGWEYGVVGGGRVRDTGKKAGQSLKYDTPILSGKTRDKRIWGTESFNTGSPLGHHSLWFKREIPSGVWFCTGILLQHVEEKGCSSSKCVPRTFSATLGDDQTFGYSHQCCEDELCNQGDFQGECQHISALPASHPVSQSIALSLCLLSNFLWPLYASELPIDFAHWVSFLPVKG